MGDAVGIASRTGAGSALGLGHLSRCLALAHALRTLGAESRMLIDGDHRTLELAMAAGFEASAVARADDPEATLEWCGRLGASALVVDSYGFTTDDLAVFVAAGRPVAVFDDVASVRAAVGAVAGQVVLHESPKHLRDLMLAVDLAITGGGQTVYELAATGTPMVAIGLAANQTPNVDAMRAAGALAYAGDVHDAALGPGLVATLAALAADPWRRADMSRRGRALVDGRG